MFNVFRGNNEKRKGNKKTIKMLEHSKKTKTPKVFSPLSMAWQASVLKTFVCFVRCFETNQTFCVCILVVFVFLRLVVLLHRKP